MREFNDFEEAKAAGLQDVALTIGAFDGVHCGHQSLIRSLISQAKGRKTAVITFDPHPEKILSPKPSPRLFNKRDQAEQFALLGLDFMYCLSFTQALAQMPAREFAEKYIFGLFKPSLIVLGYDFVFGKDRGGDAKLLTEMGHEFGAVVVSEQAVKDTSEIISSSLIREKILSGDVARAAQLLGRAFYLEGEVIAGKKLGRTIGVPTANLKLHGEIAPAPGVYQCVAFIDSKAFKAVTNIGTNPTVSGDASLKVETHLLDFDLDLYGKTLRLEFHSKLRDEKKFSGIDELKAQIHADISRVRGSPSPKS